MPRDGNFTETPSHENLRKLSTKLRNLPSGFTWSFRCILESHGNGCYRGCAMGLTILNMKSEAININATPEYYNKNYLEIETHIAEYLGMELKDFYPIFGINRKGCDYNERDAWQNRYGITLRKDVSITKVADQIDKYLATVDEKVAA